MTEVYHLRVPTIGIQTKDGQTNAVTVPADALLVIPGGLRDDLGIAKCQWEDRTVSLLVDDLRERGEPVPAALFSAAG